MLNLKNKKVLVTGGAGFIGSHTVDALIREGARVIVVDNLSTGRKQNLNPRAKFYKINIKGPQIEKIILKERPAIIYHFAFFVSLPDSTQNPILDLDCLVGSVRILKAVRQLTGFEKFIFASSGFVYGNSQNIPHRETDAIDPISSYIVAKRAVENYLQFFNQVFNVPYVILRYATVYGPRQVKGAMADYIRQLSKNRQAKIWGNGEKTRDYIYIDDVVSVNMGVLNLKNNYMNQIFNVGTGQETTLNHLYKSIAKILRKTPSPIYLPDRSGELMRFALSSEKLTRALRWRPKVSLEQGLRNILKSK